MTICTVGTPDDKTMSKPPFTYFGELTAAGVKTVWGNPEQLAQLAGDAKFDVVVDNNGKDLDSVGPVADFAVKAGARQFLFVSSAGMYKPTATPPHLEGDAVKESAGHAQVGRGSRGTGEDERGTGEIKRGTGAPGNCVGYASLARGLSQPPFSTRSRTQPLS